MNLRESIKKHLRLLSEEKVVNFDSPNNNFVVIAGGPGAGKSFITGNLINLDNVKNFNVDNVRVLKAKELWGDEWEENISTPEGYEEILVRTPLDLAQQRNSERPRSLPNDMVAKYHDQVKDNMRNMIPLFDSVWTVDNKELIDLNNRPSDNIERIK